MDDALNRFFPSRSWARGPARVAATPARLSQAPEPALREAAQSDELTPLVREVAAGDKQALARLYARSVAHVYPLALRITQRKETAEEVVEDVYVQAWQTAQRFDPSRGNALAWLLMICRSRSLDARRRMDPAVLLPDPHDLLEAGTANADTPREALETTQDHAALHRALATLTPSQRQLVGLAFLRGLTHAELSRHMGLPLGTVKSRMREALAELRRALADR